MKPNPPTYQEKLPNNLTFEMIEVQGGTFTMGDDKGFYSGEKPAHQVSLDTFLIARFPVTQDLWRSIMKHNPDPSFFSGDQRPVESVSWEEAQTFIAALNEKTGGQYRLPTDAEWEYAARGGAFSRGFTYAGSNQLKEVGWFRENSHNETQEVGRKQPNELGLCDMSGNVWEWCVDWYDRRYYEQCKREGIVHNPTGPEKGISRVIRGGGWLDDPSYCRVSNRLIIRPDNRDDFVGFRLACAPR